MKEYNIQFYKMKFDGFEDATRYGYDYDWKKFIPRYYFKKFKSLSDLAKYIYDNGIYMSELHSHILHQLTRREYKILNAKICAMYNKYYNEKV